ncbi:thioredoxin [Aequorivita sp. H23M31]|uniref:Thioredoxin n=1 Tax=Aequorivita ciconiae TaxID=2494375 RepID=A0A410G6J0_9FLAO|nr:thioredoxin family protein [Aequorivita sp. H23M31]QAA82886.1 thioredoxin [Aequorivita sp. H23M31]
MKNIILIFATILMVGCNSTSKKQKSDKIAEEISQDSKSENSEKLNETTPYEESIMLIGKADRQGLEMKEFSDWFDPGYKNYTPNKEVIEKLKPLIKDVDITLFMGTWCEDSHRDVPHLYKILDELNYDESKMQVYAVSEEKTTPQGYEDDKNIIQVPTIIFYRDGKELGRIVEYSIYTVEQDMLDILSGKDYKNPYSE